MCKLYGRKNAAHSLFNLCILAAHFSHYFLVSQPHAYGYSRYISRATFLSIQLNYSWDHKNRNSTKIALKIVYYSRLNNLSVFMIICQLANTRAIRRRKQKYMCEFCFNLVCRRRFSFCNAVHRSKAFPIEIKRLPHRPFCFAFNISRYCFKHCELYVFYACKSFAMTYGRLSPLECMLTGSLNEF